MSNAYSVWLGCRAVLQIDSGESRLPLRVQLINESSNALRVRIDGRWDVDIPKEMIVRVEADNHGVPEPSSLEPSDETLA